MGWYLTFNGKERFGQPIFLDQRRRYQTGSDDLAVKTRYLFCRSVGMDEPTFIGLLADSVAASSSICNSGRQGLAE
jgi:hypothetical protein